MSHPPVCLIALAITPVQAFIREARKAQDLWSGSLILSHMAGAAMGLLRQPGLVLTETPTVQLISPYFEGFRADDDVIRPKITNEVLALIEGADLADARKLAEAAANEAIQWWRELAADTLDQLKTGGLFDEADLLKSQDQVQGQFFVPWAVVSSVDDPRSIAASAERLHRMLGAAKRCRQLHPYVGDDRPKCTLCGQWEQAGTTGLWNKDGEEFNSRLRSARPDLYWAVVSRLEGGGNERPCVVCLVKRFGPVLSLKGRVDTCFQHLFDDPGKKLDSPLRFPSTAAIAWIEQKERLITWAKDPQRIKTYQPLIEAFNQAAQAYGQLARESLGRHSLRCHDMILNGTDAAARDTFLTFLRLDGTWLEKPGERDAEQPALSRRGHGQANDAKLEQARERLKNAYAALCKQVETDPENRVNFRRVPPLALLRADADKLGELQGKVLGAGGPDAATELSQRLAKAVTRAVDAIETTYRGRAIFSGGDELLALIPARWAMDAAEAVARIYESAILPADDANPNLAAIRGQLSGGRLTASIAVAVVAANRPLRLSIAELTELLDQTKAHRRNRPDNSQLTTRHALGLAIIPGSGNIKRAVIGLEIPGSSKAASTTWRTLKDVLRPLTDALSLPDDGGLSFSPKIYREWVGEFEPAPMPAESDWNMYLPWELLPGADGSRGIALAEFSRLARRHIDVKPDPRNRTQIGPFAAETQQWVTAILGPSWPTDRDEFRDAVIDALTDRVRAILLSGSDPDASSPEIAPWATVRNLLIGVTALGTRELR